MSGSFTSAPGDRHPLHLSAGKLVGLLVHLFAQPYFGKRLHGSLPPLTPANAGDGQRQFHVGKKRLVGNQVIALKHKTDGVIPVGIPVPVLIFLRGDSIDDQISAVIPVQTADNIKKRRLSGTAGVLR